MPALPLSRALCGAACRGAARHAFLTVVLTAVVAAGLVAGSVLTTGKAHAADPATNPYERGPEPSVASISAATGPFAVTSQSILDRGRFGAATVYYPTSAAQGKYGVVSITPGYLGRWSDLAWLGPRLASQGFVVIGVDTTVPWDLPQDRAREMKAAIAAVRRDPTIAQIADFDRVAVSGWSMGGGGSLDAAVTDDYKAVITFAPWELVNAFSKVTEPTLIIGGQQDMVAPPATMSLPFYHAVNGFKAYLELAGAGHSFPGTANPTVAAAMITWLKVFVDDDARYVGYICPHPAVGGSAVSRFRSTCS
jgi:predicted dienelactone hydrolase